MTIIELENQIEEIEKEEKSLENEERIMDLLRNYKGEDEVISFKRYLKENEEKEKVVINTGYEQLDNITSGFHEGDLITITAPTGQGKTTFCQNLTSKMAKMSVKSLWFSYEVSIEQFINKFGDDIPDGYLPKMLLDRKIVWIERKIVEGIAKFGVKAIFIDHLHYLFDLRISRSPSLEIGEIMRELKLIARKYNIIIFIVAHTKKIREEDIISIDSLRDSSFTGQESDYVIGLWRIKERQTRKDIQDNGLQYKNESIAMVLKNRYTGQLKSFKLYYKNNHFYETLEEAL